MFYLLLILLIAGISLGVGLFVGGLFAQGYLYTEPSHHVTWGAPATAGILFAFYSLWCLIVVFGDSAPGNIAYADLFRFSPRADLTKEPARELWAIHKDGKKDHYVLKKYVVMAGKANAAYRNTLTNQPWDGSGVAAIAIKADDQEKRFDLVPEKQRERGAYHEYVSSDGWVMKEYDNGPTGVAEKFFFGRFVANVFLNLFHFALWFVGLWLLMRFQWAHALGFAIVLWLIVTLIVLPMLLNYAAEVSQARHVPTPSPAATAASRMARDLPIAQGGSYPPGVKGLQRQMRQTPLQPPLTGPCLWTARMKYSLQLG